MKKNIFFLHAVNISMNPQQVLSVARAWYNSGYRVYMFTPWESLKNVHENFIIVRLPALGKGHLRTLSFGALLFFILPVYAIIFRPFLIYSRQTYLEIFPVLLIKILIKTKYVLNINGWLEAEISQTASIGFLNNLANNLYYLSYKYSDCITSVTPEISTAIADRHNYSKQKILTIGNGVNLDYFKPVDRDKACAALTLPIEYDYLLFSGSFKRWHGLDFGIQMFHDLLLKRKNVKLLIVGSSALDNDQSIEDRTRLIAKNGTRNNDVLFTGFVDPSKISLYINAASLCLTFHPRLDMMKYGLAPLKIPEYMACKRAIVCTNVGGLDKFIEKYDCGVWAEAGNIQDYVEKVDYLLKNKREREKLAENGHKAAVEHLDWNKIAQNILNFINMVSKQKCAE